MMLSINSKMKNSAKGKGLKIVNFTLPAFQTKEGFRTCPNAGNCVSGCYARMGAYIWPKVYAKHESNLKASFEASFSAAIGQELLKLKPSHVRIHDSGDFYSAEYLEKWVTIAASFPGIQFYAYTKMVELLKSRMTHNWPSNFSIIFSLGGKQDSTIDQSFDRHSRVFSSLDELQAKGYIDASHDDMLALTDNPKVGLVYHGNKNFDKTNWNKI